ncbi:MAG: carbohydrate ABC transporter permease [Lachnospiraceae bacterium]|nr:carbohydrate ABC transporter permease [Lachnospiraceae bacterium]
MNSVRKSKYSMVWTIVLSIVSVLYIMPIILVLINSFKRKAYISREPFSLPNADTYAGFSNYVSGAEKIGIVSAFINSVIVTVGSVILIILCCSMCAWYITRVKSVFSKIMFYLCVFSMIVPFQMVMFTLSKVSDTLHLTNPIAIVVVYLGFGAGLSVFMFCGFAKSIPLEIEEAAMIDGCNPIQTYFQVVMPILKPTCISVAILQAMWIWNDYLLPSLILDKTKYKTIPIAIQYLKGGYGSVDMGAMMAMLIVAVVPIIIFYLICQKYIIEGVVAGAVKG